MAKRTVKDFRCCWKNVSSYAAISTFLEKMARLQTTTVLFQALPTIKYLVENNAKIIFDVPPWKGEDRRR